MTRDQHLALERFAHAGLATRRGKVQFPPSTKRLKVDVGLSVNAPQSAIWLGANPDICVIGVEPVNQNIAMLKGGQSDWPTRLDPRLIGQRLFLLPVALANVERVEKGSIFVTDTDPGRSSLLEPSSFGVVANQSVEVWPLSLLLSVLPWHSIPLVDHLKIDAQGLDLEIVKSAGEWIHRVLAVTAEPEEGQYKNSRNSSSELTAYMKSLGFVEVRKFMERYYPRMWKVEVSDPTFVNPELYFSHRPASVFLYQRG